MNAGPAPLGVLHVNLGSPAAPTASAVRAFLDEFLGDPRVVDLNPLLWWCVRKAFVLPRRAPRSAALYARIWTDEGSPLVVHSRRFCAALAHALGPGFRVESAMRYGEPSLARGLAALRAAGARRVLVLTAFPQASRTTTGTVAAALAHLAGPTELVFVPAYFDDAGTIAALAEAPRAALAAEPRAHLVQSFHGLPQRYVDEGDPYREHCERTARARWLPRSNSRPGAGPWPTSRASAARAGSSRTSRTSSPDWWRAASACWSARRASRRTASRRWRNSACGSWRRPARRAARCACCRASTRLRAGWKPRPGSCGARPAPLTRCGRRCPGPRAPARARPRRCR